MNNTPTPRTDASAKSIDQSNFEDSWKDDFEEFAWVTADFARTLERELTAVTEQRDGLRAGIDCASDQLSKVTEQRDRLTKAIEPLKYWRDISECDCSNPLPQGGCLRCDLDKILNLNQPTKP